MKGKDLTGKRFGKLTVLRPTRQRERNAVVWRCRFKQKCYYLGGYDKIDDAAVRAEAEEKIFGDFLKWYDMTYGEFIPYC